MTEYVIELEDPHKAILITLDKIIRDLFKNKFYNTFVKLVDEKNIDPDILFDLIFMCVVDLINDFVDEFPMTINYILDQWDNYIYIEKISSILGKLINNIHRNNCKQQDIAIFLKILVLYYDVMISIFEIVEDLPEKEQEEFLSFLDNNPRNIFSIVYENNDENYEDDDENIEILTTKGLQTQYQTMAIQCMDTGFHWNETMEIDTGNESDEYEEDKCLFMLIWEIKRLFNKITKESDDDFALIFLFTEILYKAVEIYNNKPSNIV